MKRSSLILMVAVVFACGAPAVTSDEQARRAYLGLDEAIGKCLNLGFAGFNSASSANISPQSTTGDKSGTLTVTGQVDQGSSANKGMRLKVAMATYSDGDVVPDGGSPLAITYSTDAGALPDLNVQLKSIPNGTLDGTLAGSFNMSGDLEGEVSLNLAMMGQLEATADGGTQRKAGTVKVTGTAKSGGGTYNVDLTL
jgi:hypothetical protein